MTLFRPVATGLALTLTFSALSYASQTGAVQGTQTPPPEEAPQDLIPSNE